MEKFAAAVLTELLRVMWASMKGGELTERFIINPFVLLFDEAKAADIFNVTCRFWTWCL